MTGKTVLITGISGFVATSVTEEFLSHGYNVIGTVRSQSKADAVAAQFPQYNSSRLSFRLVPDMAVDGAFDEAVKGVDGVIHTASPVSMTLEDNERDMLIPAIRGTTNILDSIKRSGNTAIKRVVITGSFAAVLNYEKGMWPGKVFTEADWNPDTYEIGKAATEVPRVYCTSKLLAERAAYEWVEREKPGFSVSFVLPTVVFGPILNPVTSTDAFPSSSQFVWAVINGSAKEVPPTQFPVMVDSRDDAAIHRLAFEKDAAAGQRYIAFGHPFSLQEVADIARTHFPEIRDRVPEGVPGSGLGVGKVLGKDSYTIDNSKSTRELGITFRPKEETIIEQIRSLLNWEKKLSAK